MTGEADGRPLVPAVGMVGAGQLARMTCQAAIGLGVGFRVLADSAGDSAAQICADVQVGDYTRLGDLLAFAGGCDVVTFDHEHVPGEHLAALERAVAVRPGADALRHTQDKLAMRERLARPRRALPPLRAGLRPGRGDGVRRGLRLAGGAQGGQRRL